MGSSNLKLYNSLKACSAGFSQSTESLIPHRSDLLSGGVEGRRCSVTDFILLEPDGEWPSLVGRVSWGHQRGPAETEDGGLPGAGRCWARWAAWAWMGAWQGVGRGLGQISRGRGGVGSGIVLQSS